jgi:hypothetical protein
MQSSGLMLQKVIPSHLSYKASFINNLFLGSLESFLAVQYLFLVVKQ